MNLEDVIIVIHLKDRALKVKKTGLNSYTVTGNEFNHSMNIMLRKCTYYLSGGVLEER